MLLLEAFLPELDGALTFTFNGDNVSLSEELLGESSCSSWILANSCFFCREKDPDGDCTNGF